MHAMEKMERKISYRWLVYKEAGWPGESRRGEGRYLEEAQFGDNSSEQSSLVIQPDWTSYLVVATRTSKAWWACSPNLE